ncbi:MAG: response regulator [Candidatus Methanoperedens sp.]
MKVLIVEDDPNNMELMTIVLKHYGHETIGAFTGESGIEKAAASRPDLILMDINLPGIDGFETTRRMRKIESILHVPIIAITASMAFDTNTIQKAGCNGYLEKPINLLTINDTIMGIIKATK